MRQRRRGVLRDQRGGEYNETEAEGNTLRQKGRGILRDRGGGEYSEIKEEGIL